MGDILCFIGVVAFVTIGGVDAFRVDLMVVNLIGQGVAQRFFFKDGIKPDARAAAIAFSERVGYIWSNALLHGLAGILCIDVEFRICEFYK